MRLSGHEAMVSFRAHWLDRTDVCCWYCCHAFDTLPIPGVERYDERRDRFTVFGVFCSWSCAKSYLVNSTRDFSLKTEMLAFLKKRVTGAIGSGIKTAPERSLLRMFGGTMEIDEFRSHCDSASHCKTRFPPMICAMPQTVIETSVSKDVTKRMDAKIRESESKNEPLRLRRSKPLAPAQVGQSDLLSSMNITLSNE